MSGYIGRDISYGNAVSQQINGTNSAGPYTLSYETSTSGVVISLDGVVQRNSVDFNIVGTALTFTSTVASGIVINVIYTGLTLTFPTPADGTVSGTKIAMGSDAQGDVLYHNGSQYTRLPKGTAGQALVMNSGATAPEWGSAGGPSLGTDAVIRTNADQINENITIPSGTNGMSAGPITIGNSYTVTVNGTWTIVGA